MLHPAEGVGFGTNLRRSADFSEDYQDLKGILVGCVERGSGVIYTFVDAVVGVGGVGIGSFPCPSPFDVAAIDAGHRS